MPVTNVRELADAVAAALSTQLGEDWTGADGGYRDATVNGPDEKSIHLAIGEHTRRGRIVINGRFGDYTPHIPYSMRYDTRTITVADTKTPEQIAREVARRLLTAYTAALAAAKVDKAEHDAEKERLDKLAVEIAAVFGGSSRVSDHSPDSVYLGSYEDPVHGDARIQGDQVKFEVDVPTGRAAEVAAFLGRLRTPLVLNRDGRDEAAGRG